ncbi:MAG: hypothetical protein FJ403_23235 [Verrucomicrobia bacterium]|nr:hypothetical protein [Verrucomicrobiota bacterium]
MKRTIVITIAAASFVAALCFAFIVFDSNSRSGRLDGQKLLAAVRTYASTMRAAGAEVPAEVSIETLIARSLLQREDVSAFNGLDVTIALEADETKPSQLLVRVRTSNGQELALLGDGSVQQLKK